MNKVELVGRLTRDPELRQTQNGNSTCTFTVACDRRRKKDSGDQGQTADFIRCLAWSKTAEFVHKYFQKGKLIGLTGSIRTGSYEKDGRTVHTTEVWADDVEFVGSKAESGEAPQRTAPPRTAVPSAMPSLGKIPTDDFEELEALNDAELPF